MAILISATAVAENTGRPDHLQGPGIGADFGGEL